MMTRLLLSLTLVALLLAGCNDEGARMSGPSGKGGSLARFTTTATHLYAVDDRALNVYTIETNGALTKANTIDIGLGVETITTSGHHLYIGKNDAMMIYDISNPAAPAALSTYTHFVSCDPVVVQDTLAYVTLRTSGCRPNGSNNLEIINIKDPRNPVQLSAYWLSSPFGLGIDGTVLFVCEGDNGLSVFNVSNPYNPMLVKKYPGHAYDVIPLNNILVLTGNDGIVQYDYSDPNDLKQLSTIPVVQQPI